MNERLNASSNFENTHFSERNSLIHRFQLNYENYCKLLIQSGKNYINDYWENFSKANPSLKAFSEIMKETEVFNKKIYCPTPHILLCKKFTHINDRLAGVFLIDIVKANLLNSCDFEIRNTTFKPKNLIEAQENFYPSFMAIENVGNGVSDDIVKKINSDYAFWGEGREKMKNINFSEVASAVLMHPSSFIKSN